MNTIEELILEVENEINELYDSNSHRIEIINTVNDLIKSLNGESIKGFPAKDFRYYTVDELTRIGEKLAMNQYNLIEYELEAYKNTKKADAYIDSNKYGIRKKIIAESAKKPSEVDIKTRTESLLIRYNLLRDLHDAEHNKLTAMKFSINLIIGRIESRIKYLLSDINNKFKDAN